MAVSTHISHATLPRRRGRVASGACRAASTIALQAIALAATLVATAACAEIIKKEDMLRGITTTRDRCAATAWTLWLNVDGEDFCVRYYLSTAGGEGTRPVIFLTGDHFGTVNTKTWQWIPIGEDRNANVTFDPAATYRDINTDDLIKTADAFSKMAKTTAIYLARIGIGGSSGNHLFRSTLLELHLMNAALDAIKQRHGFEGFHLAGQSGGSTIVTGLAAGRSDIACAASWSGRLMRRYYSSSTDSARQRLATWSREPLRKANSGARKSLCSRKMGLRRDSRHPILDLHRKAVPGRAAGAPDVHIRIGAILREGRCPTLHPIAPARASAVLTFDRVAQLGDRGRLRVPRLCSLFALSCDRADADRACLRCQAQDVAVPQPYRRVGR